MMHRLLAAPRRDQTAAACRVFSPPPALFSPTSRTAVWLFQVRGKEIRRSDFSYLGHPSSSTSPPPPPPPPSPSLPSQTAGVTGLQCKPLFTLAVILQVIKTTWSSPTISPLNARCVMTSWLPLPPISHTHTHTHTYPLSQHRAKALSGKMCVCACRGHLNIIWCLLENHVYLHG